MGRIRDAFYAGLVALAVGTNAYGQATNSVSTEDDKPFIMESTLDNFSYKSQRNVPKIDGKCKAGVIFNYNLLLNGRITQADSPGVHILSRWFYDIDNDGKFGKAEEDAIKKGIPIYMSNEFNSIANEKIRKFLKAAVDYKYLYELLDKRETISKEEIKQYQAKVTELEAQLKECGKAVGLEEKTLSAKLPLPEPPAEKPVIVSVNPTPSIIPAPKYTPKETPKTEEPQSAYLSLLAQANSNIALNSFGGSLGLRFNPLKDVGFGVNFDANYSLDELIDSYNAPMSARRTAYGTITDTNIYSLGLSAEAQLGPVILGGGADYTNWIRKVLEQIKDNDGTVLKSNTNSTSNGAFSGKVYGGLEFEPADGVKLGAIVGYDWNKGVYAGGRAAFRLGGKNK